MKKKISSRSPNYIALTGWITLCEGAGVIGSLFTFSKIPGWYQNLIKPTFSPPNWLFGPVWTLLYLLMGIAAYRISQQGMKKMHIKNLITLFLIHLGVNSLWSIVFFGLENIGGAIIVIALLWGLIAKLIFEISKIDRMSSYLLVPYLLWVSFASLLNISLFFLNL